MQDTLKNIIWQLAIAALAVILGWLIGIDQTTQKFIDQMATMRCEEMK
jgi:hypothetical protein